MIKLFTSDQMRALDAEAIRVCGIPSLLLMEHAGHEVAFAVGELLRNLVGKKIAIVCGPGNNGGDGFVTARILKDCGAAVEVFLKADEQKLKGDSQLNYQILRNLQIKISNQNPKKLFQESDCIVDAIFGTGLKRDIQGEDALLVQAVNESSKPVVAIDLPSGIDADTGKILGIAVHASLTVTLGAGKIGLLLYPGREHAGKIKIAYIAIPQTVITSAPSDVFVPGAADVKSWLPAWKPDLHKGERGKVFIMGGSPGLSGAVVLSATAASESGAGLTYAAVPESLRKIIEKRLTDIVKVGLPETKEHVLGNTSFPTASEWFDKVQAIAIGPGIGRAPETGNFVRRMIQEYRGPMVIDADGLFPMDSSFLKTHGRPSLILTPHEGEMAKICGLTPENVHKNRLMLAREKANEWDVTLVLKGASTLIASRNSIWINPTGNPGMAVGGSGDVLTGLTVSLLAQGMEPLKAACAAAFIHGETGDMLRDKVGIRGVTASKMASNLFRTFQKLSAG